jgi:hypothetical protein
MRLQSRRPDTSGPALAAAEAAKDAPLVLTVSLPLSAPLKPELALSPKALPWHPL